jgi:hypothetical protein
MRHRSRQAVVRAARRTPRRRTTAPGGCSPLCNGVAEASAPAPLARRANAVACGPAPHPSAVVGRPSSFSPPTHTPTRPARRRPSHDRSRPYPGAERPRTICAGGGGPEGVGPRGALRQQRAASWHGHLRAARAAPQAASAAARRGGGPGYAAVTSSKATTPIPTTTSSRTGSAAGPAGASAAAAAAAAPAAAAAAPAAAAAAPV